MKITGIELNNIKGYKVLYKTNFSTGINIIVGQNNSGKSAILNSILSIQNHSVLDKDSINLTSDSGCIVLYYEGEHLPNIPSHNSLGEIYIGLPENQYVLRQNGKNRKQIGQVSQVEPDNLIYPYLSKRKVASYSSAINEQTANSVNGNFINLYAKIDRLIAPQYQPGNKEYIKACNDVLGFEVSTLAKGQGKEAVQYIHNSKHIPLSSMGEGVANMLGLITDLCVAENKIFLIEEPENDIHPRALKALLKLLVNKSDTNQFFISTHSNIVMKHLGSADGSKIFHVTNDEFDEEFSQLRLSSMREVADDPVERIKVLEELGYDFFDSELWKAWLFLEESSAEQIIRDYLIKWFVPDLKNDLKTFSAGSTSKIEPKFDDFNKLFVFLHLEPTYKNKVWVYIDDGNDEGEIISRMKTMYAKSGWDEGNFNQFSEHDFERYYPQRFQEKVDSVLSIANKKEKMREKSALLKEVIRWISEDGGLAKQEFKESAAEIIGVLELIKSKLT